MKDGQILIYLDSGITMRRPINNEIDELLNTHKEMNKEMIVYLVHNIAQYTKRDALVHMNMDNKKFGTVTCFKLVN